jgi:hypothetical protein
LIQTYSGNDDVFKACACGLKTPTNDEGCPILDEDGKVGLSHFVAIQEQMELEIIQNIL